MYTFIVIFTHALMFIGATTAGVMGKYNPASPEEGKSYVVWFSAIIIFNILIILLAYIHLRVRNVWIFLLTTVIMVVLFIYVLPHAVLYIEGLL